MARSPEQDNLLRPLSTLPRKNIISSINGAPGYRVLYTNNDGQSFTVDVTSENQELVAQYIATARVGFQGSPIITERRRNQWPVPFDRRSSLEEAMLDVLYSGKQAFLFSDAIARLFEEADQPFIDLFRKAAAVDWEQFQRFRAQASVPEQDLESLGSDVRSILAQHLQPAEELEEPTALNIELNWAGGRPDGAQRVEFAIDPSVTFFEWKDNINPHYDVNAVHSYWKTNVTYVSATVTTSGGSVDATLLRNGWNVSGIRVANDTLSHTSEVEKPGSYRLRIRGRTRDPNTYNITGTWEE